MQPNLSTIKSVLFDLDGTLIDSVPAYFRLLEEILRTVGLPPVSRTVFTEFMTNGLDVLGKMIPPDMAHRRDELIKECITVGRSLSEEMFRKNVKVFPGVKPFIDLLRSQEIPMGVVTSTHTAFIDRKMIPLKREGLADAFSEIIAIEDAPRKKPAPDPLLICAQRLGLDSGYCIYVGDSCVDIQAGKAAGMMTAAVLTGLDSREALEKEAPELIIDGVGDLYGFFT